MLLVEAVLTADEREALAEFEKEPLNVLDQLRFQFAFVKRLRDGEEIEDGGVFQRLPREVRLRGGKRGGEVGNRFAVPLVSEGVDLQGENVPAPAVRDRPLHAPTARGVVFHFLHQDDVMRPGDRPEE